MQFLQLPATSSILGVNILLSSLFLYIHNKCFSFNPLAPELSAQCTLQNTHDLNSYSILFMFLAQRKVTYSFLSITLIIY
jgi:hypothetical protein